MLRARRRHRSALRHRRGARDDVRPRRRHGGGRLGRFAVGARCAHRDAQRRRASGRARASDRSAPPISRRCRISRCRCIGHGEAEYRGATMAGAAALAQAGLAAGHADAARTASRSSARTPRRWDMRRWCSTMRWRVLDALNVAAALSCEGFRANLSPLDPRVQAARPAPGQNAVAARLAALLAGSALWQPGAARRVQDPLSFRCVTQVHGAALAAAHAVRDARRARAQQRGREPAGGRRDERDAVERQLPRPGPRHRARRVRPRAGACRGDLRRALHQAAVARASPTCRCNSRATGPRIRASPPSRRR